MRRDSGSISIYFALLLCGSIGPLRAEDPQQVALVSRAQIDFNRVQQAAGPELPEATRCEQSQAAVLAITPPAELAGAHFRKGYCTLASALITHRMEDFRSAAADFEKAIQTWPAHAAARRNGLTGPVSSSVRVLATVARLEAGTDDTGMTRARQELENATDPAVCTGTLMTMHECQELVRTGRLWMGWIELKRHDLFQVESRFAGLPESGWVLWASGELAFRDRNYPQAADRYQRALEWWRKAQASSSQPLADRLAPQPDLGDALRDWGGAQLLSGDTSMAIATLNDAVKSSAHPARALYYRARAEELAGRMDTAMADYSLASRTAFADAQNLASGEAHLYRGILLYRRKDYAHAENEFMSALNFEIPAALRPDAVAWRHMAALAGGSCGPSRASLEQSLAAVSPYFPKHEARALAGACPLSGATLSGL